MKKLFFKLMAVGLVMGMLVTIFCGCGKQTAPKEQVQTVKPDDSIPLLHYDDAPALLQNPDRGLRMETYITLGDPLGSYPLDHEDPFEKAQAVIDKYKADSPTLCQVYVYLSNYRDCELDALAFAQLEEYFQLFRSNGIRMLLRFAYSTESVEDAPYKIVSHHLTQLKEWFSAHSDLVNDTLYCLQTGIIGYWGEGHSYQNLKSRDIKKVIADVCDLAPEGIYTQVRTYKMLQLVSDENAEKVGIHDDYIIGDMSHQWSFVPSKKASKFNKAVSHAKLTINDGEMPWGNAKLDDKEGEQALNALDGRAVLQQLQTYSMTSFSLEHNYCEEGNKNSMARWKEQYLSCQQAQELGVTVNPQLFLNSDGEEMQMSIYDIMRYHLGYQLVLSNYAEQQGTVQFSVTNYGFAAPLNFNYFAFVYRDTKTGKIAETEIENYDKTGLQSGASVTYTANLPENCEAIGVKLDTFKGRGVYARFANATTFKDGIQYFK